MISLRTSEIEITLLAPNQTNYLCVELNGMLVADRVQAGPWEHFIVEEFDNGLFAIKSVTTGKYLSFLSPEECEVRGVPRYTIMATADYVDIWEAVRVTRHRYGIAIECPYWDKFLSVQHYGGGQVLGDGPEPTDWEVIVPSDYSVFNLGPGSYPGVVNKLTDQVRPYNRSFGDGTGPRYVHGCTDFGGIVKHHENRDVSLSSLDMTASHQQFIRVAYRLNGGFWQSSGVTVDPIRDPWWEPVVRDYVAECAARNLRIVWTCADMYNWSDQQAVDWITKLAQICAEIDQNVVILHEWNEMRGTCPDGEAPWQVAHLEDLTRIWEQHYPWSMRAISDPGSQDKNGMEKLSRSPANIALIHNTRWGAPDAIRRAFNAIYENYPGKPVCEGEPTGPNGSPPHGPHTRLVWQPTEDHDDLLAIYSQHIFSGQMSTYFNDPALVSREPLDSTWGFKEIPELWRQMEVPENIGQGILKPGHHADAPLQVVGSNALRADCTICPNGEAFGIISGGSNWKVKAGRSGELTIFNSGGQIYQGNISAGEVVPNLGPKPVEVRIR